MPIAFDSSSECLKRLQLQSLKVRDASEAPALGHENHLQTWASPWTNSASGLDSGAGVWSSPRDSSDIQGQGLLAGQTPALRGRANALKLLHLPGALKADPRAGGYGSLTGE